MGLGLGGACRVCSSQLQLLPWQHVTGGLAGTCILLFGCSTAAKDCCGLERSL